jgi:transcriptional regulator with GAF, ATPase, and Fis domain
MVVAADSAVSWVTPTTRRSLREEVQAGRFRWDLYYRASSLEGSI